MLIAKPVDRIRAHASHKGSFGDVAVVGGVPGMSGAALLAATAALHAGAGRVFVARLDTNSLHIDTTQAELMFRTLEELYFKAMTVVCGCGGGQTIHPVLHQLLSSNAPLVIDADDINWRVQLRTA